MTPAAFMKAYEAATNSHDLANLLPLIAEDAVYLFSDGSCHVGKAAVTAAIAANFETIRNETYGITALSWLAKGDKIAACIYEFHWSGEIDGTPVSGSGRGTTVIERRRGTWQVVHEHLSRGGLAG